MQRILMAGVLAGLAAHTAHSGQRQLSAHEHGVGTLNIAFEGNSVAMEFEAPGADIVGFEHEAESAEDKAKIEAAIGQLARPMDLFTVPAAAGCTVVEAKAALISGDDHGDDHGDHAHKAEKADDHGHGHSHGHGHGDDDHAEEAEGESHTEFHAEYMLNCSAPGNIDAIAFKYFDLFPNAEEVEVQLISDKGSQGFEVERDNPSLPLGGAI
ncbi:MAG: DUF2796 domain-containing protein [Pseudomonadota bacterium]